MSPNQKEKLKNVYSRHIERIGRKIVFLENWSIRFSYIRLIYFVAVIALLYAISKVVSDLAFFLSMFLLIGGFIGLIIRHNKIRKAISEFEFLQKIKEQHIARMVLDWEKLSPNLYQPNIKNHAFADDLNIVGDFSIHHLIDNSIYEGGSEKLGSWFLNEKPETETIKARQFLVKELISFNLFRDKLKVLAHASKSESSDKDWTMEQILGWLRLPKKERFLLPLLVLSTLSIANIMFLVLLISGKNGTPFFITFLLYLTIYNLNRNKIEGLFDASFQINKLLGKFGNILMYVEEFQFKKDSKIEKFCSVFKDKQARPSDFLRKARRLGGAASLQMNQVLWPLVNMVLPWDLFFSMKMEQLKIELEPKLTIWLNTFYEFEALNSLANFAAINPDYEFAEIMETEGENLFEAQHLGHPLIKDSKRVSNGFQVKKGQDLFLITGSNMAGKSTFLRTVGVNLCLAFAGAPCCASSIQTRLFRLFTSINVKDSLDEGLSHFYAEVRRLKRLLDELEMENERPLFFFVDEIFKGTNNRERFKGSTAYLKKVAGKNGIGMVSTHDLELANLESEIPQLSNWHFLETIENGKMHFEYKIQPGPCPTTNALKIMEQEGLPI